MQGRRRGEEKDANNDSKSSPVFTHRDLFNMVLKKKKKTFILVSLESEGLSISAHLCV